MDVDRISKEIPKLRKKSQKRFVENVLILFSQLSSSVCLRGPYRLIVDSNIIMRLESYRNGNITEGVLSVFLFFDFLKRSNFRADLVIRPSVFYEFVHQKQFRSVRQHWDEFKKLRDTIGEELSITPFFDGIETFHNAEYYLKQIEHDVALISKELNSYKTRDWKFDFVRPHGGFDGALINEHLIEVPPFFAAQGLYKELGLTYFDETQASRFLIEHICKNLSECRKNDQRVIDKYNSDKEFLLTKVLKLTAKGNLTGIADVDILTLCNVQTQFSRQAHGRYYPASIGLSMDTNLSNALSFFSGIHLNSGDMFGGVDNQEDNSAKLEAWSHDQARLHEGDDRTRDILRQQQEFFQEVSPVLFNDIENA